MTVPSTCLGTYEDSAFYGHGLNRKSICTKCGKDHFRLSLKDKIFCSLVIAGIPATFAVIILSTKIFWCVWLSDNNCWSHFP